MPALAQAYAALVTPSNDALDVVIATLNAPGASMSTTRPAISAYLVSITDLNARLPGFAAAVGATMRADMEQLRQGVAVVLSDVQATLRATTEAGFEITLGRWDADTRVFSGGAQLVRADLGLAPVGAPTPPA